MAKKLTRHRKHSPNVLLSAYVEAAYEVMDPDNTEEVLTTLYMAKNIVMGTRAADEFLLDLSDVSFEEASATQHGGVTIRPVLSKKGGFGENTPFTSSLLSRRVCRHPARVQCRHQCTVGPLVSGKLIA